MRPGKKPPSRLSTPARASLHLPPQFKVRYVGDNSPEYQEKHDAVRRYRQRIARWLIDGADRMPMHQRQWFRISEITDYCARIPGDIELDKGKQERAIELMRKSILTGEFDDADGRSKVANLLPTFAAELRFARGSAGNPEYFRPWVTDLWIRRADCEAWFKRNGIQFPKDWVATDTKGSKKRNAGRKPVFDRPIHEALVELFEWHGDLSDDDREWSVQADVEKAVRLKLGEKGPRAVSTVRNYVSNFIAERQKKLGPKGR